MEVKEQAIEVIKSIKEQKRKWNEKWYQKVQNDPEYKLQKKEKQKRYYEKNKEQIRGKAKLKGKTPEFKEKYKIYRKNWRSKNPEKAALTARKSGLKKRYNITLEEFNDMLKLQDYKCAICGNGYKDTKHGLVVDHNHITGKNRKLLCTGCNTALGSVKENIVILENMIKYLKSI